MKTLVILIASLLSIALPGLSSAAILVPTPGQVIDNKKIQGELVKAVLYNGMLIPVVDLPQVEIIEVKQGTQILKGSIKNGELVLEVNLPVVEISAYRTGGYTLQGEIRNGSFIGFVELPVIEIVSAMPLNKMTQVKQYAQSSIPVIELREIVITATVAENLLVEAVMNSGKIIPVVNLPIVEITPGPEYLVSSVVNSKTLSDQNLHWIYTSLVNYGISVSQKVICKIYSTEKSSNWGLSTSSR